MADGLGLRNCHEPKVLQNSDAQPHLMKIENFCSRREFLGRTAAATAALALLNRQTVSAQQAPAKRFCKIGGFSKPFQNLSFDQTADLAAEIGWDGLEIPVRKGGQVLPERVEDDLPKLVAALKKRDIELLSMATDIQNASDPLAERVLRTASKLGIKLYRVAHLQYNLNQPIPAQVAKVRAGLKELMALNKELGMCGAYENHSGKTSVGAPIWDVYDMIKDFDPKQYGVCFDIGHATIEGGLDWAIQFRLIEKFLSAVYVKDFLWRKGAKGWKEEWCPLGEGMIDPAFFQKILPQPVRGILIQHFEYPVQDHKALVAAMKRDRATLESWLSIRSKA